MPEPDEHQEQFEFSYFSKTKADCCYSIFTTLLWCGGAFIIGNKAT